MRLDDDDLDEVDLSVCEAIQTLYAYGVSRAQAERALRERIAIMCDVLEEFEDGTRPDCFPFWHHPSQRVH